MTLEEFSAAKKTCPLSGKKCSTSCGWANPVLSNDRSEVVFPSCAIADASRDIRDYVDIQVDLRSRLNRMAALMVIFGNRMGSGHFPDPSELAQAMAQAMGGQPEDEEEQGGESSLSNPEKKDGDGNGNSNLN